MRDVEITLDKPRTLRFTLQALLDLQRISGQPLAGFAGSLAEVSVEHLVWGIWAGLKHAHESLTVEQVRPLIQKCLDNGGTLTELVATLDDALVRSGLFKRAGPDVKAESLLDPLPAADATPV